MNSIKSAAIMISIFVAAFLGKIWLYASWLFVFFFFFKYLELHWLLSLPLAFIATRIPFLDAILGAVWIYVASGGMWWPPVLFILAPYVLMAPTAVIGYKINQEEEVKEVEKAS